MKPIKIVLPPPLGLRWYAVETHARCELSVLHALLTDGFDVFLPLYLPAPGAVLEPAFPGYLLVEFDLLDPRWCGIGDIPGVFKLLGADREHPVPLPDAEVERLVRLYGADGEACLPAPPSPPPAPLRPGTRVAIVDGPFAGRGYVGTVEAGGARTVWVVIDGKRVEFPCSAVAVAKPDLGR